MPAPPTLSLEVLRGIAEQDWSRIRQVVVEVHQEDGHLSRVGELLEAHGFRVECEQATGLQGTELYTVYAVHRERSRACGTGAGGGLGRGSAVELGDELRPVDQPSDGSGWKEYRGCRNSSIDRPS